MKRIMIVITGILMLAALSACSVSTANIASVDMAKGYSDGKAVNPTKTFSPTDNPIYCVVQVNNAPDETKVKAVWTAVDAVDESGATYKDQNIGEKEYLTKDIGSSVGFNIDLPNAWPVGKYKVDIYLNDKLDRTVEFEVAQ